MTEMIQYQAYVEVSFSQPIGSGSLTYHVPDGMGTPQRGARVLVPVNRRRIIGYVTSVHNDKPLFNTLGISQVIDPVPLISDQLFELAGQTAKDCIATVGELLHCMLPAGIKKAVKMLIRVNPELSASNDLSEPLMWLVGRNWVNYSLFVDTFPLIKPQVKKLVDLGHLQISHSVTKTAGPKINRVLKVSDSNSFDFENLTPKEKQVLKTLLGANKSMNAATLARAAKTSQGPIKQLKNKNIICEVEERVFRRADGSSFYKTDPAPACKLTSEQSDVLKTISYSFENDKKPVLIRGVTCSGKTEVYLQWVAHIISKGLSAIVLVPEISLTPQMMKRFIDRFQSQVAILHSKLSSGERFDQWEKIRTNQCKVVVGARSAVFAPVAKLGTIILDEEGETSFKQGESPRYHAREVAARRCEIEKALLIMGSATPTIDSYYYSQEKKYYLAQMTKRVSEKKLPKVKLVDMRNELVSKKNRSIFSNELINSVKEALNNKQQIILFLNRRGYSSFVFCRECGESVDCTQCNISLVYHSGSSVMRCHYCNELKTVPVICPACQSRAIKFFGAGTQRVEAEAKRYFPSAIIERLDSDTASGRNGMEDILHRFGCRNIDILIGTQMVAKGLDFPNVTVVGILAADSILKIPDFRAAERNFSMLAQVAGRAGRGDSPGKVVLQTYNPDHHSIRFALEQDYCGFFQVESQMRKKAGFPPFVQLASFLISGVDKNKCENKAQQLAQLLKNSLYVSKGMLLGPSPAPIERMNNRYRFQLMLKCESFEILSQIVNGSLKMLKKSADIRVSIDINPFFML